MRDVLIPETLDVVFEENNGALVLVAGSLNIQDTLKDDFYGISMAAVKMRKVVQVGAVWQVTRIHAALCRCTSGMRQRTVIAIILRLGIMIIIWRKATAMTLTGLTITLTALTLPTL